MALRSGSSKRGTRAERHDPSSPQYVGDVSPGSIGGTARQQAGWTQDPVTGKIDKPPMEEGKITIKVRGLATPPGDVIPTERITKVEPAPLPYIPFGQKVLAGATAFFMKPYETTQSFTEKAVKGVQAVSRKVGIGETAPFKELKMLEAEKKAEAFELEKKRYDINVQRITKGLILAKGFGQVQEIKKRYSGVKFEEVEMPGRFEEGKFVYKPYTALRITSPKLEKQFIDVQKTFAEAEVKDPLEKLERGVRAGVVLSAVTIPAFIAGVKYRPLKMGKEFVSTAVKEPIYTAGVFIGTGLLTKGIGKAWGRIRPVKMETKVFTPAKTRFVSKVDVKGLTTTTARTITKYKQQVTVAGKPFGKVGYFRTQRTFDITSKGKVLGDFETGIIIKKGKGVKQELLLTPKETGMPVRFKLSKAQLGKFQAFAKQEDVFLYEYGLRGETRPSPVPRARLTGRGYGLVFGKEATLGDLSVWQKGIGVVKETTGKPARAFSLGMGKVVIKTKVPKRLTFKERFEFGQVQIGEGLTEFGLKEFKKEFVYVPKVFRRATLGFGRMEQLKFFDPQKGKYVYDIQKKGKVLKLWKEKGAVIVLKKSAFEPKMAVAEGKVLTEEYPYGFRPGAMERLDLDTGLPSGGISAKFDVSPFKAIGQIRSQFRAVGRVPKTAVVSYAETAVAPLAITRQEGKRIRVSKMVGASLAKTLQLPKTKVVQRLGVSQRLGVLTFQISAVAQISAVRQRTALRTQLGLRTVTTPTPSIVPTITVPGTPTGKFPFFVKLGDDIMKGVIGKMDFKAPKFMPKYAPSVEAKYFKIKGKKLKGIITGLELRPLIF